MTHTSGKKILAWQINGYDGQSVVVFHHHGLAARREGANRLDEEFEDVECTRTPEFDEYIESKAVPRNVLLDHGWWFSCGGCQKMLHKEDLWIFETIHCNFICFIKSIRIKVYCWSHNTKRKIDMFCRSIGIFK